eukprot:3401203-Prymnesium_polylepis.1
MSDHFVTLLYEPLVSRARAPGLKGGAFLGSFDLSPPTSANGETQEIVFAYLSRHVEYSANGFRIACPFMHACPRARMLAESARWGSHTPNAGCW